MVLYTIGIDGNIAYPPQETVDHVLFYDLLNAFCKKIRTCGLIVTDSNKKHWKNFKRALRDGAGTQYQADVNAIFSIIDDIESTDRIITYGCASENDVTCSLNQYCQISCARDIIDGCYLTVSKNNVGDNQSCGYCNVPLGIFTRLNQNRQWENIEPGVKLTRQMSIEQFSSQVWKPLFRYAEYCHIHDRNLGFHWSSRTDGSIYLRTDFNNYIRGIKGLVEKFGEINTISVKKSITLFCGFRLPPVESESPVTRGRWLRWNNIPLHEKMKIYDNISYEIKNILKPILDKYSINLAVNFPRSIVRSNSRPRHNRYIVTNQAAMFIDRGVDWLENEELTREIDYGLLSHSDRSIINSDISWYECRL